MTKERCKELRNRVASIRACMQNADPPDSVYSMALEAVDVLDAMDADKRKAIRYGNEQYRLLQKAKKWGLI